MTTKQEVENTKLKAKSLTQNKPGLTGGVISTAKGENCDFGCRGFFHPQASF